MLRSGQDYLETLRDGRRILIGSEVVEDVTTHPAFAPAARTVAGLYDLKRDPSHAEYATFTDESGETVSSYYLKPQTPDDLRKRTETHRLIAEATYGMFGRSPDHVSSFVTAMAMRSDVFARNGDHFARNIENFYDRLKAEDAFASYAIVSPQAARDPAFYQNTKAELPCFRVVKERDDGVIVSGMKMLATGGAISNYIFIGNIFPLAPDQIKESITCAIPVNAPGLELWSRRPMLADSEFESPLMARFDETDAMVVCNEVFVPWEMVFTHDDADLSRGIYIETPAHSFGNHQSNVRYRAKLKLIAGLASKVTQASGAHGIPAVRETLARLAAQEAMLDGMIYGQIEKFEDWGQGYVGFNRRMMYAALNFCTESYSAITDTLRELCGGGVFQMPGNITVMEDPKLRDVFETYFLTPQQSAVDRMKLYKLAWDVVGSEFAGRHQQYEKFYAGAGFVVKNHNFRETPWPMFDGYVDDLLASYDIPRAGRTEAAE